MTPCYCGSGSEYETCCRPILVADAKVESALALMRARYSAYVTGQVDFLHHSLHPKYRHDHDTQATKRWAEQASWVALEIVDTKAGGLEDDEGWVEFIARYKEKGLLKQHHEVSHFKREHGHWYYVDGDMPKPSTQAHGTPKIGRNSPCPCGSGKKYKKCCGA